MVSLFVGLLFALPRAWPLEAKYSVLSSADYTALDWFIASDFDKDGSWAVDELQSHLHTWNILPKPDDNWLGSFDLDLDHRLSPYEVELLLVYTSGNEEEREQVVQWLHSHSTTGAYTN
jgi:hypothetical protein